MKFELTIVMNCFMFELCLVTSTFALLTSKLQYITRVILSAQDSKKEGQTDQEVQRIMEGPIGP